MAIHLWTDHMHIEIDYHLLPRAPPWAQEAVVLKVGDKAEMEDMANTRINEIHRSTVQHHLPTKDVQVICLYPLPAHVRVPLGQQVLWVFQQVESGVIDTQVLPENLIHQTAEVFIPVQSMFLKLDKTKSIKLGITAIVTSISNVNRNERTIAGIDRATMEVAMRYRVLIVDHRSWETTIHPPNKCHRPI